MVVDPLHEIPVSYCLSRGALYYMVSSASLINQSGTTGGNRMYRDCIAFAVYSSSQATMDIMLPSQG